MYLHSRHYTIYDFRLATVHVSMNVRLGNTDASPTPRREEVWQDASAETRCLHGRIGQMCLTMNPRDNDLEDHGEHEELNSSSPGERSRKQVF